MAHTRYRRAIRLLAREIGRPTRIADMGAWSWERRARVPRMSDDDGHAPSDDGESVAELVEQLGRDTSRLIALETALSASRHVPELRRAALGVAAVVVAVLAFAAAFALANWAAVAGLSSVLPTWLAALVLASAWLLVGAALLTGMLARLRRTAGVEWWRLAGDDRAEAVLTVQASRDRAEQAVRATMERLSDALAREAADQLADAVMPFAGNAAAEIGDELIEASEEVVDAIEEQLPGGGAVAQMVDLVLLPGRLGIRVATTVLRGSPSQGDTPR